MSGAYPSQFPRPLGCLPAAPLSMIRWMGGSVGAPGWCLPGQPWQFTAQFLRTFGGRYNPDLTRHPYLWLTSTFIHQHFIHLFSNIALLALIGCEVERRYGTPRLVATFVLTVVAGNLLSAVAEARCAVVVGLSGAVFGLLPLYTIDIIKHWRDMTAPALHVFFFTVFLIAFGASIIRQPQGISHLSHVGGFLMGLFPALLFQYHVLPHHDDALSIHHFRVHPSTLERVETCLPILSLVLISIYLVVMFVVFYVVIHPNISCPSLS